MEEVLTCWEELCSCNQLFVEADWTSMMLHLKARQDKARQGNSSKGQSLAHLIICYREAVVEVSHPDAVLAVQQTPLLSPLPRTSAITGCLQLQMSSFESPKSFEIRLQRAVSVSVDPA